MSDDGNDAKGASALCANGALTAGQFATEVLRNATIFDCPKHPSAFCSDGITQAVLAAWREIVDTPDSGETKVER